MTEFVLVNGKNLEEPGKSFGTLRDAANAAEQIEKTAFMWPIIKMENGTFIDPIQRMTLIWNKDKRVFMKVN